MRGSAGCATKEAVQGSVNHETGLTHSPISPRRQGHDQIIRAFYDIAWSVNPWAQISSIIADCRL